MNEKDIAIRHISEPHTRNIRQKNGLEEDIVLDKLIFSEIFHKDIRRVFIYKRAERLGNALHLIAPALRHSESLRRKAEATAVALLSSAAERGASFKDSLARELLALSGILSMAKAGGLLSAMNADLITAEIRSLLGDVAAYEEPRLSVGEIPTLAELARSGMVRSPRPSEDPAPRLKPLERVKDISVTYKGHTSRQESILSFIGTKGHISIKDISMGMPGISEKTIQRELQGLVASGKVLRHGERRWSTYSLA